MKNILVTGVSRGLGSVITRSLLAEGYAVLGTSRSRTAFIDEMLTSFPNAFEWISFDLERYDDVKEKVFKKWIGKRQLYGFVNNAAMAYDTLVTNINTRALVSMTHINQTTPIVMTKEVIRNMLLHDVKGSIVHISSVSAHTGYKGLAMYAATKAAIEAFSKTTAREWGVKGIRSNCIASGFMETDMTINMPDHLKEKTFNRTSLKTATNPNSIAATVAFLLSNDSQSITGQTIHVDAGTI